LVGDVVAVLVFMLPPVAAAVAEEAGRIPAVGRVPVVVMCEWVEVVELVEGAEVMEVCLF